MEMHEMHVVHFVGELRPEDLGTESRKDSSDFKNSMVIWMQLRLIIAAHVKVEEYMLQALMMFDHRVMYGLTKAPTFGKGQQRLLLVDKPVIAHPDGGELNDVLP